MLIPYNLNISSGVKLADLPLGLSNQSTPIRGVVVDNGNSTTDVIVYAGSAPIGTPYIVKAGWSRGFTISDSYKVYIQFPNTPTAAGTVYIAISDEPQLAFATQIANVTVSGPVTVTGTVAVSAIPAITIAAGQTVGITGTVSVIPPNPLPISIGDQVTPTNQLVHVTQVGELNVADLTTRDILLRILAELQLHTVILSQGLNVSDNLDDLRPDPTGGSVF